MRPVLFSGTAVSDGAIVGAVVRAGFKNLPITVIAVLQIV